MYVHTHTYVLLINDVCLCMPLALSSSSRQFLLHTGDSFVVPLKGHRPAPDLTCEECDVCVCVRMYICACVCVWYIRMYMCVLVSMCVCMHKYVHTYVPTYLQCTYVGRCVFVNFVVCIALIFDKHVLYMRTCMYVRMYMYRVLQNGCRECHSVHDSLTLTLR